MQELTRHAANLGMLAAATVNPDQRKHFYLGFQAEHKLTHSGMPFCLRSCACIAKKWSSVTGHVLMLPPLCHPAPTAHLILPMQKKIRLESSGSCSPKTAVEPYAVTDGSRRASVRSAAPVSLGISSPPTTASASFDLDIMLKGWICGHAQARCRT